MGANLAAPIARLCDLPRNRAYRDAAGDRAALWVIADVGHTGGLQAYPGEYERRTVGFLDRAL